MLTESLADLPLKSLQYQIELFRRATLQDNLQDNLHAQKVVQQCFTPTVLAWLHRHPNGEAACRVESEEQYVALAFARFWQETTHEQIEFDMLATALRYLHVSLNSVIQEELRNSSHLAISSSKLPDPGNTAIAHSNADELWKTIQGILPDARDQRLAYLLFHCGLKPREIFNSCREEFNNLQEIIHLRKNIMERLLHSEIFADHASEE
jgi:hypothetical protein